MGQSKLLDTQFRPKKEAFPVITKIINAVNDQTPAERPYGNILVYDVVKSMAEENGFNAFRTAEERELAAALRSLSCGPRAAHYAWRLYRRYRQSGDIALDAISY